MWDLTIQLDNRPGAIARWMAEAGVNIEMMYSDHADQLILVVDDEERGRRVSESWMREVAGPGHAR